jgi:hypothetical protein
VRQWFVLLRLVTSNLRLNRRLKLSLRQLWKGRLLPFLVRRQRLLRNLWLMFLVNLLHLRLVL